MSNLKRILYIGNFSCFHSTEQHVRQALEALGHNVVPCQEDKYTVEEITNMVMDQPTQMVLYTRTWGLNSRPMLHLWKRCKEKGIPTVSYHLDLYYGLERKDLWHRLRTKHITSLENDPFWKTEYCFTVDGDPEAHQHFLDRGINHYFLRAGVYHKECVMPETHWQPYPVVFCGSTGYHPEWPYRPKLIQWLRDTYGDQFHKFGNPECTVRNLELNAIYGKSQVIVGDTLNPGFCKPYYTSDRVYETLGRGGFLIHPYIQGMEEEFEDGRDLVFYKHGDLADLQSKIDFWLRPENRERAEEIRRNGHEKVKANYTYVDRMRTLMRTVFPNEGL